MWRRKSPSLSGDALAGPESQPVSIDDRALYVYTSGTTGLPKAANVSHYRLMVWTHWFAGMMDTGPADRMYNCLPMYHSDRRRGRDRRRAGQWRLGGDPRRDFPRAAFWDDIVRFDCTLFQYIGELCRYLLQAPGACRARRGIGCGSRCGNGLRGGHLGGVQAAVPHSAHPRILCGDRGQYFAVQRRGPARARSVARRPSLRTARALALVKFDVERNAPLRDENGFCVRCAANETGEAIGRISEDRGRGTRSTAIRTATRPNRKSCATCSSPATPGSAPAT